MSYSPHEAARRMVAQLRSAHEGCAWLASQQSVSVRVIAIRVEQVRNAMTEAHELLQTLQGSFANAVIATRVAEHLEPPPADLPTAYTAARTAVLAMLDDYGANVLTVLPFPYTWNAVERRHVEVNYNIDTPANFKTRITAARDALEVFA